MTAGQKRGKGSIGRREPRRNDNIFGADPNEQKGALGEEGQEKR